MEVLPQARARLLPAVTFSVARGRVNQERDDKNTLLLKQNYNTQQEVLIVKQPVYSPRLTRAESQAQALVRASQAAVDVERLGLLGRVTEAYLNAVLANERVAHVARQVDNAKTRLKAAELALVSGTGTRTDILDIRAEIDLASAQLIQARQTVHITEGELASLMGLPAVNVKVVRAFNVQSELSIAKNLETLKADVFNSHPELMQREYLKQAAEYALQVVQAEHYPAADLSFQKSRSVGDSGFFANTQITAQSVGVQVSVPIYQGGLIDSKVRQALASLQESEFRIGEAKQRLENEFRKAYFSVKETQSRWAALQTAMDSANLTVLANQRSAQVGVRSQLDVVLAEQRLTQVQLQLAEARIQAIMAWVKVMTWANADQTPVLQQLSLWFEP
jgi:outer membrane protein/protease secretion system outer membrane protein